MSEWIAIVGWDELAHPDVKRGDLAPMPWHRTYARLLDDDGYWRLGAGARGVYHGLLLVALRGAGRVPTDTLTLSRKAGLRVSKRYLAALVDAGLIGYCASEDEARHLHASSPARVRRDREERISRDLRVEQSSVAEAGNSSEPEPEPMPASPPGGDPLERMRERISGGKRL
jgi:hypothetical protein